MTTKFTPPPPPPPKNFNNGRDNAISVAALLRGLAVALCVVAGPAFAQAVEIENNSATVFAADPDDGHYVESWTADCANEDSTGGPGDADPKRCVLSAPVSQGVGVVFARILRVNFSPSPDGGTLVATVAGQSATDGALAGRGQTVVFTADPDDDRYVGRWTDDCEGSPTGEADPSGGAPKQCEIVAGTKDIRAGVVFTSVADCESQKRQTGTNVAECGSCLGDLVDAGGDPNSGPCQANPDDTLLAEAAKTAPETPDLQTVREALSGGANPNAQDNDSVPVLIRAALNLHAEMVSVLVTFNADRPDPAPKANVNAGVASFQTSGGTDGGTIPILMAGQPCADGLSPRDWIRSARVLRYFDDAMRVSGRTREYNLLFAVAGRGAAKQPLDWARESYENNCAVSFADRAALREMRNILHAGGGRCASGGGIMCDPDRVVNFPAASELDGGSVSVAFIREDGTTGVIATPGTRPTPPTPFAFRPTRNPDERFCGPATACPPESPPSAKSRREPSDLHVTVTFSLEPADCESQNRDNHESNPALCGDCKTGTSDAGGDPNTGPCAPMSCPDNASPDPADSARCKCDEGFADLNPGDGAMTCEAQTITLEVLMEHCAADGVKYTPGNVIATNRGGIVVGHECYVDGNFPLECWSPNREYREGDTYRSGTVASNFATVNAICDAHLACEQGKTDHDNNPFTACQ